MENGQANGESDADLRFFIRAAGALATALATNALAGPTPPDRHLDAIVRTAARAIPSPEGALFLIDRERQVLTFDVVIGQTAAKVKDLTVPLGHGIAGLVAVSGQPLAVANAQNDPRHAKDIAAQSGYFPSTILATPVVAPDGMIVGVLELLDRQGQPAYDLEDMELLALFAEQAAMTLEHKRAYSSHAALIGGALAGLAGLPPAVERQIEERAAGFAASVEQDPAARRALELATLAAGIAARGEAAQ